MGLAKIHAKFVQRNAFSISLTTACDLTRAANTCFSRFIIFFLGATKPPVYGLSVLNLSWMVGSQPLSEAWDEMSRDHTEPALYKLICCCAYAAYTCSKTRPHFCWYSSGV